LPPVKSPNDDNGAGFDILFNPEKSPSAISELFNSIVKKFYEAMNIVFENGLLKVANIIHSHRSFQ